MSGAPIIIGIIQFARPTKARHDGAEHHHQAVQRGHLVEERRLHELHAGLEQLRPDDHGKEATEEEHGEGEPQVHRADVLVVGGEQPAADAFRGSVCHCPFSPQPFL
jgi:hypothetical protein